MKGVLLTALQFYTRTRVQRLLLAGALMSFAAQAVVRRQVCPCPGGYNPWTFLLGMMACGVAALSALASAWDFRRISALRTVSLIPHARLTLAAGMFLAQCMAAGVGTTLVLIAGSAEPLTPLAWGGARGTFEMLLGVALSAVVLLQVATGPSRVMSVASLAFLTALGLRADVFMRPTIFGMPKADVLALGGILAWCLFAAWYVIAWRAAAPFSGWIRGRNRAAAPLSVTREAALNALLLGQTSLLRVCRQQLGMWVLYNAGIVATQAVLRLMMTRHPLPPNYSMAIVVLLYAPLLSVNIIAGVLARGSRRLWLRGGEPRSVLYAIAARLAWQSVALVGLPSYAMALAEMRFLPHEGMDLLFPLALCVTLTPSALYLGLLNFRRRLNLSFLALFVVAFGAMLAGLLAESPRTQQLLWLAPIALLAIGAALRMLARRRWYGIDWLKFRAERETSPFALRRA